MKKAFRYKILPTKAQREQLQDCFHGTRRVYNWALGLQNNRRKDKEKMLSYNELSAMMTQLRQAKQEGFDKTPFVCLQQSLRNLNTAYTNFFKHGEGVPAFKSRKRCKRTAKFIQNVHFDFENWTAQIPTVGKVKMCHNNAINPLYKLGTLTVTQDRCGTYWCSVTVETYIQAPPKAKVEPSSTVGIDLGIKDFAVLSNGIRIDNPKFFKTQEAKLARYNRAFARKQKDSKNQERMRFRIARLYRKLYNQRMDFAHKRSLELINTYNTICLEDLNVKGMMQNGRLSKSIQDVAWGEFVRCLQYKAEWSGKNIIFIDRFEPSSKRCNHCGHIKEDLQLSDREWICPHCGSRLDRDLNAATNIMDIGLEEINARRQAGIKPVEGTKQEDVGKVDVP